MLRAGNFIKAKLIEAVEEDSWIVSFKGKLINVKNNTDIQFKKNLLLNLQVIKEKPLELKVVSKDRGFRNKLDVIV